MPPLEYVGGGGGGGGKQSEASRSGREATKTQGEGLHTCSSAGPKLGDKVLLQGLSKAALNGKEGVVASEVNSSGRVAVKMAGSTDQILVRPVNIQLLATAAEEASDDSMPPLEYVATSKPPAKREAQAEEDAASDDSMPPL
eukprot:5136619-Amphidinium_carterae.1